MKKVIIILFVVLPFFVSAQNQNNFFEHTKVKIDNTQINTIESDFGPAFVKNELWYSAFTPEEIEMMAEGKTKDIFYNSYAASIDENGILKSGKQIKIPEISKGYHSGPVSYCSKTGELFVTMSNFDSPEVRNKVYRKADVRLKIIVLKVQDGVWTKQYEMPFNDSTYSVGHPAVNSSGDKLYFSSNMPNNGAGETDIYLSTRNNGVWGEPVNLGDKINTPYKEMFPVLFQDNTLVFASNRDGGMGGLDLYYSMLLGENFGEPVALNQLNSESDDFGLVIHSAKENGYFVSNRPDGVGSDDIYKVDFEGIYNLELVVKDKSTMKEIVNPKVNFDDNILGLLKGFAITRLLKKNSTFTATTEIEGYKNDSKTITTVGKPFGTIKEVILVEKVKVGQTFVIKNILYDFNKWDILPDSKVELDKLVEIMNKNPEWKVELGSHTDSRGSDLYNEKLSQKRSDTAVNYIISQGISKERIIAKGYGETMLVNKCDDGVDCTPEEHRVNRRTEFKILDLDMSKN